jgi:hypothetical protein
MRNVWTSRRAISLHVALVLFVPACVALTWWQLARALGGNTLSWVYTFEWPFFAAYAVFMWWKLVHDDPVVRPGRRARSLAPRQATGPPPDGAPPSPHDGAPGGPESELDDELAAYNRYLAELSASGRQKRW